LTGGKLRVISLEVINELFTGRSIMKIDFDFKNPDKIKEYDIEIELKGSW
jgi:hypothetical protein